MGPMWSGAFPTCNWFHFPTFLLLDPDGAWHTKSLSMFSTKLNPGSKEVKVIHGFTLPAGGCKASARAAVKDWPRTGGTYCFPEPEVHTVHLHQRGWLQRRFLPDFSLHALANVSGPNHLEAKQLVPRRRDERAPEVHAVADELSGDHWPRGQGWDGSWNQSHTKRIVSVKNRIVHLRSLHKFLPLHCPLISNSPGWQCLDFKPEPAGTHFFSLLLAAMSSMLAEPFINPLEASPSFSFRVDATRYINSLTHYSD